MQILCIDDANKPKEVNKNHWVKKDVEYTPVWISYHPNQGCQGVLLAEIALDESDAPYEFYKLNRFAIKQEDIEELLQLMKDCSGFNMDVETLLRETEIELLS